MKALSKQKGFGFFCSLGLVFTVIVGSIFLARLGPVYWEHFVVNSHFNKLAKVLVFKKRQTIFSVRRAIIGKFERRLLVENIRNLDLEKLTVTRTADGFRANLKYIMDTDFVGNIDFIVMFHDVVIFKAN